MQSCMDWSYVDQFCYNLVGCSNSVLHTFRLVWIYVAKTQKNKIILNMARSRIISKNEI